MKMKERPILFSAPMVRAILSGAKTQTRRIVKPQPELREDAGLYWRGVAFGITADRQPYVREFLKRCPYGAPGDRLWVRETWFPDPPIDGSWPGDISWQDERRIDGVPEHYRKPRHCIFAASWTGIDLRWRPGIHMPRWASRITLEITGVRVERLQAISEADARAEGVYAVTHGAVGQMEPSPPRTHRQAFELLWREINGAESWEANPFVWVVEFRRIEEHAT